jgi:hypothetical protein
VILVFGLATIETTLARVGPLFSVEIVFGTLLAVYGALRLYWTLK